MKVTLELPDGVVAVAAAQPELVSQKTSEVVLGIPRRHFLESMGAYRAHGGEVICLGRLRLVRRESYVAWLRNSGEPRAEVEVGDDGAAALAAAAGLRLVRESGR